jgi:hypothetical protein
MARVWVKIKDYLFYLGSLKYAGWASRVAEDNPIPLTYLPQFLVYIYLYIPKLI